MISENLLPDFLLRASIHLGVETKDSTDKKRSSKWILLSALSLGLPLSLLFAYNYSSIELRVFNTELLKIGGSDSLELDAYPKGGAVPNAPWLPGYGSDHGTTATSDSITGGIDEEELKADTEAVEILIPKGLYVRDTIPFDPVEKSDSSKQRVLLIGDSEAGGLYRLFNDYCVDNGHQMVAALIWNSATIFNYGYSSKVDDLIRDYQPSLIVVVLGLNELYARDLERRTKAANMLRDKFGQIPYLWIGPANYMEDNGINKIFEEVATPERFILSKYLNLPKGDDKRHPNHDGYRIWMEYIARCVQSSQFYDFEFEIPKKFGHRVTGKVIHTNAASDKGY